MVFKHLEEALREGDMAKFFSLDGRLREPNKTAFFTFLDINALLRKYGLQDQALVFGGYAVLAHLASEYGDDIPVLWRGSDDVDLAGTERVRHMLHENYTVSSDRNSPNVADKRTIKIRSQGEPECKVDFCMGDGTPKYEREERTVLGIPTYVASPLSLMRAKLEAAKEEEDHKLDIAMMLSVLERRGYGPEQVVRYFERKDRKDLYAHLNAASGMPSQSRIGIWPTEKYFKEVKRDLRKL